MNRAVRERLEDHAAQLREMSGIIDERATQSQLRQLAQRLDILDGQYARLARHFLLLLEHQQLQVVTLPPVPAVAEVPARDVVVAKRKAIAKRKEESA